MPSGGVRNRQQPSGPSKLAAAAIWVSIAAVTAGLIACYLLLSRGLAGEFGLPLDDSWIHVRFAQNLARGEGFSFSPGEPTSTTTGALWTLLLALAYRVTHEHLFTGIVLNWILCVLLCVVVYHLSLTLVPRRWLALSCAGLVACTIPLPWWALSGMEPPLYGLLSLLGVLLHIRLRRERGISSLLSTLVFALAGLARPECLLLFPLAMIDRALVPVQPEGARHRLSRWAKELAWHTPVFALLVAPLFIYNYRATGYFLPSSYYSKLQWTGIAGALTTDRVSLFAALVVGPAREVGELLLTWAGDNLVLLLPFFVGLGLSVRWARSPGPGANRSLLIPMVLFVQPVAWALVAGYRPPGFQSQRYLANLNPLFLLLGLVGGWWITEQVRHLRGGAARTALTLAVFAASLAGQPAAAITYASNVRDTTAMHVAVGRWVRDHTPRGALLAVNDVGAIGVISEHRVIDLQGLVTPEILPRRDMAHRAARTAPQAVFEFIVEHRPDYLIIFPSWYPELDRRRDLFTPVFSVLLKENITAGSPLMVVYRTTWPKPEEKGRDDT
ncbi:MAG: hypothetical protein JSV79_05755 [Armatimonadota bacterium]|nr:MAG: hypothetical protein JSV79_05755 [Armatimonadota bacterium]